MMTWTRAWLLPAILAVLSPVPVGAETLYALVVPRSLVRFDSAAPGAILGGALVTGLANTVGETLVGIDFRRPPGSSTPSASTPRGPAGLTAFTR